MVTVARRWAKPLVVISVFALAIGASRAEAGLAIRVRSNGVFSSHDDPGEKEILVGDHAFRISNKSKPSAHVLIVRLDRGLFWELDPENDIYVETTFDQVRERRETAERDREKAREEALRKLSGKELDDWLQDHGLRRDGERILTVSKGTWQDEVGTHTSVQRIAVEINGVTQVAVWQTNKYKEYKPPTELYEFYDRCRLLPDGVAEKLKENAPLFPHRIFANLDYFSAGSVIETEVIGVSLWSADPSRFQVPSTCTRVAEFPKETVAKKEHRCPVCGKEVDAITTPFFTKDADTGEKVYFDAEKCWMKFLTDRRQRG